MNKYILNEYNLNIKKAALPHQIATVDYLISNILTTSQFLIYHVMGSGKTITLLLFTMIYLYDFPEHLVHIIVPNINIINVWLEMLHNILIPIYNIDFNINNIRFSTHGAIFEKHQDDDDDLFRDDNIIIIDEAHKIYNSVENNLKALHSKKVILVTGSPLTNTIYDFSYLSLFFGYKNSVVKKGKKVIYNNMKEENLEGLKDHLRGKVSIYNVGMKNSKIEFEGESVLDLIRNEKFNELKNVIKKENGLNIDMEELQNFDNNNLIQNNYNINVIPCIFSELENINYEYTYKHNLDSSFMFSHSFLNISLCSLNNKIFDKIFKNDTNMVLYPDNKLEYKNKKLIGSELLKLNISSKFKFFINKIKNVRNQGKHFIFFKNSSYGTLVFNSILKANGLTKFGEIYDNNNFLCIHCGKNNDCEDECTPMYYVLVTGVSDGGDINNILSIFNSVSNENGEIINIIIGSEILSESYSINEIKNFWLFTIPDTRGKFEQTKYRIIRNFSHKKPTIIKGYILISLPKNVLSFDLQKMKYLLLKENNLRKGEQLLIESSTEYNQVPDNYNIRKILYINRVKYLFKINTECKFSDLWFKEFTKNENEEFANFCVDNGLTIENEEFGLSILVKIDKECVIFPYFTNLPECQLEYVFNENLLNDIRLEGEILIYNKSSYNIKTVPINIQKEIIKIFDLPTFEDLKKVFISLNSNSKKYYIESDNLASKEILIIFENDKYYINYKKNNINYRNIESLPKKILRSICEDYEIKIHLRSKDMILEIINYFKNKKSNTEKFFIKK